MSSRNHKGMNIPKSIHQKLKKYAETQEKAMTTVIGDLVDEKLLENREKK